MASLYLVALLPPEPVFSATWALKQEVHRLTGSRNAVRLPPHITLIPPLHQPDEFEGRCTAALTAFAATQSVFTVGLQDFAWFGDRTLFVQVSEAAAIRTFHAALVEWCAIHLPEVPREKRPFTPHLTLATRDLPPAQVPELQHLFESRSYAASFPVKTLTLFRHNGHQWQPRATFPLNPAERL
ncbi:2'-5' RNA ligase family protein [Hymenobacter sp. BT186]|uniref:2'-5' RNA ligase family protein n=1 Tax=Hymenobacter telluris TaxID=2816474 RepID=A0A939JE20_9BACT|nr:2'-5' RNA ligase family protein [Hymenobacter telluris]MBO0359995.1 2'-5' RNA ligase family protein [Hymenobacter telluris]MBW3376022.1 2'-5' RNA ligase family protein [Hymenobacter norwichensis]